MTLKRYAVFACIGIVFLIIFLLRRPNISWDTHECHWYFHNYTPSTWENNWYNNIETLQERVCETLSRGDDLKNSINAMERLLVLNKYGRNQTVYDEHTTNNIFSRLFYRQRCLDSRKNIYVDVAEASQLIEPLIGLLRDPFSICARINEPTVPSALYEKAVVQSKRFLLLSVAAPYHITSLVKNSNIADSTNRLLENFYGNLLPWMYGRIRINPFDVTTTKLEKKVILFDLGSGYFGSESADINAVSTRWFYEYYKSLNVKFDRIIAFEAAALNPKSAWEQLPDDVFPIYSIINVGCASSGKFNPWTTLKGLAKPQDHVIIKMDIDTYDLENSLINQIIDDPTINSLIDEFFFEHHTSVNEMKVFWGSPTEKLPSSYRLFTKLRNLGIRMHSWP